VSLADEPPIFDPATPAKTALSGMSRAFRSNGAQSPDLDARFLLQDLLGVDGAQMLANPERPIGDAAGAINNAVRRRLAHEPVSRILGWREFYGRRFQITPDVLDPRPDTETLIGLALDIGHERGWASREITLFDIGAGSGAIIITLLAEWPLARGYASDVSRAALDVARENAESLGVANRLTLIEGRGLAGVAQPLDVVVSNPPYIPGPAIARLEPDVRNYDPMLALDGGPDGLDIYKEIANEIRSVRHTQIILEVGDGQSSDVVEIFRAIGGARLRIATDLGGKPRAVALEIHC
jgi:release factor glutamine methyltransferase